MARALLSLGASEGHRRASLSEALRRLERAGLAPVRVSGVWETEPVGAAAGPRWFCNLAVVAETTLGPLEALAACLRVERDMGRVRDPGRPGGPRTIDIDLLACGDDVVRDAELTLPHPRLHERRFVLAPLAEIDPDWRHPLLGRTVREMLDGLTAAEAVRRLGDLDMAEKVPGTFSEKRS